MRFVVIYSLCFVFSQTFAQSIGTSYHSRTNSFKFLDANHLKMRQQVGCFSFIDTVQYSRDADTLYIQIENEWVGQNNRMKIWKINDYTFANESGSIWLKDNVYQKYARKNLIVWGVENHLYYYSINRKAPQKLRKQLKRLKKEDFTVSIIKGEEAIRLYGKYGYFGIIKITLVGFK